MEKLGTTGYTRSRENAIRSARRKMRYACAAGLVVGIVITALTAIVVAFFPGSATTVNGETIDVFTFLDAALFFVLSYFLWWRRSVFAAIMMFAFCLVDTLSLCYQVATELVTLGMVLRIGIGLTFVYLFFEGARGSVVYHRLKTHHGSAPQPRVAEERPRAGKTRWALSSRLRAWRGGKTRPTFTRQAKRRSVVARRSTTTLAHTGRGLIAYVSKHWRGELPLVTSFWMNVVLVNICLRAVEAWFLNASPIDNPLMASRFAITYLFLGITIVYPWQIIGCWRSANRHIEDTKRRTWARAAQSLVILGCFGTLGNHTMSWHTYQALFATAFG